MTNKAIGVLAAVAGLMVVAVLAGQGLWGQDHHTPVVTEGAHGAHGSHTAPAQTQPTTAPVKVANAKCPMMGGVVEATKANASLTREYKGQTVLFCCGGCPAEWDKLTDAEKAAKLAKVATPAGHIMTPSNEGGCPGC